MSTPLTLFCLILGELTSPRVERGDLPNTFLSCFCANLLTKFFGVENTSSSHTNGVKFDLVTVESSSFTKQILIRSIIVRKTGVKNKRFD